MVQVHAVRDLVDEEAQSYAAYGLSNLVRSIGDDACSGVDALNAQSFYGSILGTVTDNLGASVPGTNVSITNVGTSEKRSAQTDASGNHRFANLVPAP